MTRYPSIGHLVLIAVLTAVVSIATTLYFFQPSYTESWFLAAGTFIVIGLATKGLAVPITESGSQASTAYLPQFAALLTMGPAGAVSVTALYEVVWQFLLQRKEPVKAAYNAAQLTISIAFASFAFHIVGGSYDLRTLDIADNLLPFLAAATVYFTVNKTAVSYIISASEREQIQNVWRRISENILLVDLAISPLAILVAYIFVRWGPLATILCVVPLVGFRYSYGVIVELQKLNRDLVRVLIKTIETQDPYTSGHSIRVAERATQIAKEYGLGRKTVRDIETAALLHDIGKIDKAYRDILEQSGPLSPDQKELIRQHPERGVSLLKSIRSLDPAVLRYVKHHHERVDGGGYPDGLVGDEIPIGARIIMVSDTIDAMMTERPYRDPCSPDEIERELEKYAGTQFDPGVVRAALDADVVSEMDASVA